MIQVDVSQIVRAIQPRFLQFAGFFVNTRQIICFYMEEFCEGHAIAMRIFDNDSIIERFDTEQEATDRMDEICRFLGIFDS